MIKDFLFAIASGDTDSLADSIHQDIVWTWAGQKRVDGKDKYLKKIWDHPLWKAKEVDVHAMITHGREAAVSGQITSSSDGTFLFCDVFTFTRAGGGEMRSITSFTTRHG